MKIKSQRDFWSGLMFVATGIVFAVGATNYSLGTSARPGPGYFPLILSVIMALLGAFVLFKSLTIETEGGDPIGSIAWRPLIFVVISIAAFGVVIVPAGIFVAGAIAICLSSLADGEHPFIETIIGAAVGLLIAFVLVMYVAPGFAWNLNINFGDSEFARTTAEWINKILGVLIRVAMVVGIIFLVRKVPDAWTHAAETATMTIVLISMSVWMFVQGLKLTIPLVPFLSNFVAA
ncbi:MAG: tripartite tricarboxylate transporter TctB family protein [Burkholderiales bacterium]|nr:tripartite tricarboxylate transporter TctB family protein [Burkholderiales bacterium]